MANKHSHFPYVNLFVQPRTNQLKCQIMPNMQQPKTVKKGEKGLIKHIHRREYFDFNVQTKYFRELKKYCALINIVHNRLVDIFWINIL